MRAFLAQFRPSAQPPMTRQSYSRELVTAATMPVALSLMEGTVVGVLAKKAFDAPPLVFAAIMSAPMFANLTSFLWAHWARGRRKVPFINLLQLCTLASVALVAVLPTTPAGALILMLLVTITRCLMAGIVTLRSTVWRHNYPRAVRASVSGRLANVASVVIAVVPMLGYNLLDRDPQAFRDVYPAAVVVALVGVWSFSRVRLRGERAILREERRPTATPQPHGDTGSVYEVDSLDNSTFWDVLRRDHFFRSYMIWQFVAGSANMASETIIIYLLATITEGLVLDLGSGGVSVEYAVTILLSNTVPMLVAAVVMPRWARIQDRMHNAQFRTYHACSRVADQLLNWVGALVWFTTGNVVAALAVIAVARVVQGVARAGGMLAWNLGHNDFASRRLVALYMGIHVTLTGIRGAIVPFVATLLYLGPAGVGLPAGLVPEALRGGVGSSIFLVTAAAAIASEFGFRRLGRSVRRQAASTVD